MLGLGLWFSGWSPKALGRWGHSIGMCHAMETGLVTSDVELTSTLQTIGTRSTAGSARSTHPGVELGDQVLRFAEPLGWVLWPWPGWGSKIPLGRWGAGVWAPVSSQLMRLLWPA